MRITELPVSELGVYARERIINLWVGSFGDSSKYAAMFLENVSRETSAVLCEYEGIIIGMLFLIPGVINYTHINMIYAMTVDERYRNRGAAGLMMDYANAKAPTVLKPECAELFPFYEKRSYHAAFMVNEAVIYAGGENTGGEVTEIEADEYTALRNKHINAVSMEWDAESVRYALIENRFWDGKAMRVNNIGAALYTVNNGEMFVKEMLSADENIENIAKTLMRVEGVAKCRLILPPWSAFGETVKFGMAKGINIHNGYLGLALN
jgi:hypothetical protein